MQKLCNYLSVHSKEEWSLFGKVSSINVYLKVYIELMSI